MNQESGNSKLYSEAGVTLILSLFVLTAVVAVSFSLGALVIREIRSSRYLAQSEPTILTAEAGAETGLFFRLRKISAVNQECGAAVYPESLSSAVGSRFEVCSDFYDKPYSFSTSADEVEVVMLIDPQNEANPAAGYSQIVVTPDEEDPLDPADYIEIRIYNIYSPNPEDTVIVESVEPGEDPVIIDTLDPTTSYAIFLIPDAGRASGTICDTASCDPATSRGIPSKNPKTFSTGIKADFVRKLQIQWSR